ncbi:MAG: type I methionyl aminopeptidase [Candidatus Saccharicenans sp.]|jgi:methionyl aminopeptidase|nr:type I methionyl aminopeptidase [Candidatus Saccharicenans sp.]
MIIYKSETEIEMMRQSSQIVARILSELKDMIKPGLETRELDWYAESRARELGAVPAFKGYRGYPASLCVSINEEIVHGIPSGRRLQEGDIVSLDFGVVYQGFYGDAALTVPVGQVSEVALRLIEVAERAFYRGLEELKIGIRLSDVSAAIQQEVEKAGFSVIRAFVGHGIGRSLHEEPQLPNFGLPGHGPRLKKGLTLAIEPMIAAGHWEVEVLHDGWTAITQDRSLSAHYEHTVALTDRGVEILSLDSREAGDLKAGSTVNA